MVDSFVFANGTNTICKYKPEYLKDASWLLFYRVFPSES